MKNLKISKMKTYFRTQEETKEASEIAKEENANTHIKSGVTLCECGESLSYFLIDSSTLNHLETFVYCESCTDHN
ncbi:MAG: hypothetical protein IID16_00770 [Candidatus Marinimicrobia bacterium]|nr:hypothetical protein [Candidatus Neomarinimicrobiota bacterium]